MKIAVIGGGAAGFFAAINAKENFTNSQVTIFEKTSKVLSKVKISGGGRCNVTNAVETMEELLHAYPRGKRVLKSAFYHFNNNDMMQWLESKNVALAIQDDQCVFPKSQQSQTIIDCFLEKTNRLKIPIKLNSAVLKLQQIEEGKIALSFKEGKKVFDKVIVTTGGSPKRKGLEWLEKIGHQIEEPVPSLFTFNMPTENITKLMGVVVQNVQVKIQKTKLIANGPLLITHWGMSGPAILTLSSFGARVLSEKNYRFITQVNWINQFDFDRIKKELQMVQQKYPKKQMQKIKPFSIPSRLWLYLLEKSSIPLDKKWIEIGNKTINKLIAILTNDTYLVNGKTTFKEEFVTCGGVSLQSINPKTLESKIIKNLYFAGEVLDIDGITGGFNFQAAWSTAYVTAKLMD
ncbi:MAG TPA: NAD(P)/FAD-dependent oxidoreductase [Flavobacteriia bacterium]|nr:NAD(P)/FAD-dependent oxidoreductase [Flavobacteriia bacterium]